MKKRRGLSTVVGMVFSIIALSTTVAYVSYSMNILDKYNQNVISVSQQTLDTDKEGFKVNSAIIASNNKFNITVTNTGTLPLQFTKIWVKNTTTTDWVRGFTPINTVVAPGQTMTNLGQYIPLTASSLNGYNIKLVTSRGNSQQFNLNSIPTGKLYMTFTATPSQIPESFTTTLTLRVVNNMSSNTVLLNVTPAQVNYTVSNGAADVATLLTPIPLAYPSLAPGDTASFSWTYKIDGVNKDTITFIGGLKNGGGQILSTQVTLADVLFSSLSTTSLQSQGIVCCRTADNIIVLHQENFATPTYPTSNIAYQAYSGQVDTSGLTIDFDKSKTQSQNRAYFITENDTVSQTDIGAGSWVHNFKYRSDLIPANQNIPSADMAFLFNPSFNGNPYGGTTVDSSGCSNVPTYGSGVTNQNDTGTRDGSYYNQFSGTNSYISIPNKGGGNCGNDVNNNKDTLIGWFKTSTRPAIKAIIYKIEGNSFTPKQNFTVAMNSAGNMVFSFVASSHSGGGAGIVCQSNKASPGYADGNWHMFAAIRTNGQACTLDMDGPTYDATNQFTGGSAGNGGDKMTTDTAAYIGQAPTTVQGPVYPFVGSLDTILYWNSNALTDTTAGSQKNMIGEIYKKNYGTHAHTIIMTYSVTNSAGTVTKNISGPTTYYFPYIEGLQSNKWGNYTISKYLANSTDQLLQYHILANTRVLINTTISGGSDSSLSPESLPMHLRIDDNSVAFDYWGSYLQLPSVSFPFPSYFTIKHDVKVTFTASNAGPAGLWITSAGTRAIFQAITNSSASYASMVDSGNASNIDTTHDSKFLNVGNKLALIFQKAGSQPQNADPPASTAMVPGTYRMYISITGYDNNGAAVTRTFYIGPVKVT